MSSREERQIQTYTSFIGSPAIKKAKRLLIELAYEGVPRSMLAEAAEVQPAQIGQWKASDPSFAMLLDYHLDLAQEIQLNIIHDNVMKTAETNASVGLSVLKAFRPEEWYKKRAEPKEKQARPDHMLSEWVDDPVPIDAEVKDVH